MNQNSKKPITFSTLRLRSCVFPQFSQGKSVNRNVKNVIGFLTLWQIAACNFEGFCNLSEVTASLNTLLRNHRNAYTSLFTRPALVLTYIYAYIHTTYIPTCLHTYIRVSLHACIHTCTYMMLHANIQICVQT